ncbi:MAG: acetate--CoA ligase family protein, partial [Deltaproteobacteria bacterium]|nr:acetate--CoA ligase family protein [Deltaproteobacteria bacterium]
MSIENLDRVFNPRAVAVVGASERQGSIGNAIMQNLLLGEYQGEIFPVNPRHSKILSLPAYSSLKKIASEVDLVVIATPIQKAPEIVAACAEKGVGGAVIISAGGKEIGIKGREIEKAILKAASPSGVRIIGPNCLGVISSKGSLNASFANRIPQPGKMAFISQSGGICTAILDMSLKEQMGFSYFVSLGSMLDVNFADMIDYLGGETDVSSIVMYVENLTRFRSFMSAARAVSRVKPIIALKAGRSQAGAAAAASHTGAMAGEHAVYEAAFKRAGIIQVKTFEELFDCAELVAKQPRLKGPGLAILTNSGGPGVMAADALSDYGIEPVAFLSETIEKLDAILPSNWSRSNPVDMLGDADESIFKKAIQVCQDAREIDGLLIMMVPDAVNDPTVVAQSLVASIQNKPFPIFAVWLGGPAVEKGRDIFNQAGIPTFDSPERAIRAFMDLYQYTKNIEMLHEIPPRLPRKLEFQPREVRTLIEEKLNKKQYHMTEVEAKSVLSRYGIPVNRTQAAGSLDEAVQVAQAMGFPVAMKVNSRDITHKSEADGVCLNITSVDEGVRAYKKIISSARRFSQDAGIDGVTVQPMVQGSYHELILGVKKDRDFGSVILFGTGGTYAEVLKDRAIGL